MKTTLTAFQLGFLLVFGCASPSRQQATFEWHNKPMLTSDQEKLLHLYNKLGDRRPVEANELSEQIDRLARQLGRDAVRPAWPGELVVSPVDQNKNSAIYNPSSTNVSFTVAIRGDEEWMGSRKGSIGRETYLPPKGTLIVSNLYWTTPRMTHRN
jgi:hypothetical protein